MPGKKATGRDDTFEASGFVERNIRGFGQKTGICIASSCESRSSGSRASLVLSRRASFYQVFYVFVNGRVAEQGAQRFPVHDDRHPSSHAMNSRLRFNCA